MRATRGRIFGLTAAGLAAFLAAGDAAAQPQPQPAPSPAPHHRHRHATHHARHRAAPAAPAVAPPADHAGTTPAPVPNPDIGPPDRAPDSRASVDPGTMQLHYPPVGEGYTPGSSPSAMDDARTAKVPGVMVKVPLQDDPPQTLPPPDGGH